MKCLVVGYLPCDFKDNDGNQVKGVSLKIVKETKKKDFVGQDIAKVWVPQEVVNGCGFIPEPGSEVDIEYEYDGDKNYLLGYSKV